MKIPYIKMHGCHNDYVYLYNRDSQLSNLEQVDLSKLAIAVSHREKGIGSDGLIVVQPADKNDKAIARMKMLNADGSVGKMCGNGIRCVAKLLYENMGPQESYLVETDSGLRTCYVVDAQNKDRFIVKVNMGKPEFSPLKIPVFIEADKIVDYPFEVLDKKFKMACVSMGNPHAVIEVRNLEKFEVEKYGWSIEKNNAFPEGVNVEFIEIKGNEVHQRTWERGSGETQACGTGACAVGSSLILRGRMASPVLVKLRGGELRIDWDGSNEVWMTGEAVTESSGEIDLSDYL
jgi:diaminopimelate epimerase